MLLHLLYPGNCWTGVVLELPYAGPWQAAGMGLALKNIIRSWLRKRAMKFPDSRLSQNDGIDY